MLRLSSRFETGGESSFCVLREICADISQFVLRGFVIWPRIKMRAAIKCLMSCTPFVYKMMPACCDTRLRIQYAVGFFKSEVIVRLSVVSKVIEVVLKMRA